MTYRVRKQALTGKLVLQSGIGDSWNDCQNVAGFPPFEAIPVAEYNAHAAELIVLRARVAQYERRAKGQRDANEKRKAKTPGFQIAGGNESF